MDIAIIYNFGEHPGGGDLVSLNIIEALLNKGHNVWLYTSHLKGLDEAIKYFSKDTKLIEKIEIKSVYVSRSIKHPYNIYMVTKKSINELKRFNLVIFFDDIPKPALELRKVFIYVHYPHAARILLNQLVPYRYHSTFKGRIIWKMHSILFKKCFLTDWNKPNIFVAVNSTLTYDHAAKALRPMHITKIYPPVQVEQITRYVERAGKNREDLAVYIGRIQPEKGIADIIKALTLIKRTSISIKIMGFLFDEKYLKHLINLAKSLSVTKRVEIVPNALRETVLESLAKAKVLIHPAHYECFGIAVVEGMAARCVPIVRKGVNGPWIDVVEQGRYGYGFESIDELAKNIKLAMHRYEEASYIAKERARIFSETVFKKRIANYVGRIAG